MPSFILGQPPASGGQPIFSGFPFSGRYGVTGGIQIRIDKSTSGNVYLYLSGAYVHPASGGPLLNSGGMFLSGGISGFPQSGLGIMDPTTVLYPGDGFFIPRLAINTLSGGIGGPCMLHDAAVSGQGRVYWEAF